MLCAGWLSIGNGCVGCVRCSMHCACAEPKPKTFIDYYFTHAYNAVAAMLEHLHNHNQPCMYSHMMLGLTVACVRARTLPCRPGQLAAAPAEPQHQQLWASISTHPRHFSGARTSHQWPWCTLSD